MRSPRGENFQPRPEGQTRAEVSEVASPAEDQAVEGQAGKPLSSRIESLRARIKEMIGRKPQEAQREVRELKEAETEQRGGTVDSLLKRFHLRHAQRELFFPTPDISHLFAAPDKAAAPPVPISESAVEERVGEDLELLGETKGAVRTQTETDQLVTEVETAVERQAGGELSEAERKKRDVATIARERGVTFIHAIQPARASGKAEQNAEQISMLRGEVDWEQKFDIVLALEPTLACSSIQKGDSRRNMWYGMGVILGSGKVEYASCTDVSSLAQGIKQRQSVWAKPRDLSKEIPAAISDRSESSRNEFGISDPKVSGFYVCREPGFKYAEHDSEYPDEAIAAAAEKRNLPLFVIMGGEVWEGRLDVGTKKIRPTKLAKPEEVYRQSLGLPSDQREAILEGMFEDSPFDLERIGVREAANIESRADGQITYMNFAAKLRPERLLAAEKPIAECYGVNKKVVFHERDGKIWRHWSHLKRHTMAEAEVGEQDNKWIDIGFGTGLALKGEPPGPEDYFSGLGEILRQGQDELAAIEKMGKEGYAGQQDLIMGKLRASAFHLYGFGEQAGQFGDAEASARALALAGEVIPRENYDDVIHRRVGEKGKFKITREDLKLSKPK